MDKRRIVKKLFNSNIVTKNIEIDPTRGLLFSPTAPRDVRYRKLQVVQGKEGIEEGDVIFVPINSGTVLPIGDEEYTIVNERDIILIL